MRKNAGYQIPYPQMSCVHMVHEFNCLSLGSARTSNQAPVCLLFGFFSKPLEERETLERWLIDARVLPLDSLPAWKDLGWDRKDKTPSQPPKTPDLK